jgi:pimeloyl-ACP methyl ester carboxylesterase
MIGLGRRFTLSPGEMFPSGEVEYRVSFPRLRSGIKVRVVERGDPAAPPVLLVPGLGCSAYTFHSNMPALAEAGFRAIAVDLKGHGLSDKPIAAEEYTIDALVEHLRDILDVLELAQPAIAGHSLGGSLVYHFVSRYPERARCVALLSPVGLSGVMLMWLYRFLTPAALAPMLRQINPRLIVLLALKRVYGKRGHFTQRDVAEYLAPSQFAEFSLAMRAVLHNYDWNAAAHRKLATVNLPAIGVWGTLDHLMPRDGLALYVRLVPRIVLRAIQDAGHIITEETPDEVNEALITLLRGAGV